MAEIENGEVKESRLDGAELALLHVDGADYRTRLTAKYARRRPYERRDPRLVRAFFPGEVRRILVEPGQRVRRGEGLLVLEAMKMQNEVTAAADGVVRRVAVTPPQKVAKGELLVELE